MITPEIETECPICEESITLKDFDPKDTSDDGQDIECPCCGEIFEEWHVEEDGTLVIDAEIEIGEPVSEEDDEEETEDDEEGDEPGE
jgi:hypothetical protein